MYIKWFVSTSAYLVEGGGGGGEAGCLNFTLIPRWDVRFSLP